MFDKGDIFFYDVVTFPPAITTVPLSRFFSQVRSKERGEYLMMERAPDVSWADAH
jgi:hypothetical protein